MEIYPIIIYTDNQYSTPGINNYLSKKFKSKSANINQFKKVSLPIMIHLNFFQSYLAYIEKNRLDKIIDSYFNFVSRESRKSGSAKNPFPWLQSNLSFDDFNYKFDKSKKNKTNQAAVLFENLDFKNLKEMEKTSS